MDSSIKKEYASLVAELFKSAAELPPQNRQSFLDERCRSNPELRAEVESLLQTADRAEKFLETPAAHIAARDFAYAGAFSAGHTIGHYEIISLIGKGGMGEVYLAQDRKLRRRVALKLVRRGMESEHIVRRFKHEQRLLAALNHPNIAQLYEADVTDDGIPFFAMEHVDGTRIDDYCGEKNLSVQQRLELFCKVCAGVHYAHQHLVVHRDIKPSNILVTADGEPKLLDFGIAKLLESEADAPEQTLTIAAVMTPEYASPEHVRGDPVTTASDVYSLGVLLYELLTEQKPYKIDNRTPIEVARVITEKEPTKPSTAIDTGDGSSKAQIPNPKLLRGDLDNIVLMAMRKEPQRRYASVAQFSHDIQRHLDGLPVIARKDTAGYLASKFIKRHRLAVSGAAFLLFSLLGGIAATLWQARAAENARASSDEIKRFLEQTLNDANPTLTGRTSHETTVTQVLDDADKRLRNGEFSKQPEIKAEVELIVARSYLGQGKYRQAQKSLQRYISLLRQLHGEDHPLTVIALSYRALIFFFEGDLNESEKIFRQVLPAMREFHKTGKIEAQSLAYALNNFACVRRTRGDSKQAESLFREVLSLGPELSADQWRFTIGTTRSTLASTLADQGRFQEALQTASNAIDELRQRGETDTPNFGFALTVLGGFLTEEKKLVEADRHLKQAEAIFRKAFSPVTLWLGDALRNQAASFYEQARYDEALDKINEAIGIYLKNFGPHYDQYPTALIIRGLSLTKMGQPAEGEKQLREALQLRSESLNKDHFWLALARSALGECLTSQKRFGEAEPLLLDSYHSLKNSQGTNNPRTQIARERLVALYEACGRPDDAQRYRSEIAAQ